MKVCMILEGSYPYVNGGVSSWMHQYIQAMPEVDFILWCIGAKASDRDHFKYTLPENVVEVQQIFLDDALNQKIKKKKSLKITPQEMEVLQNLLCGEKVEWSVLFQMCRRENFSPVNLLSSRKFLDILTNLCESRYAYMSFAEYFHTMRSMLLPELYLLTTEIPEADIYHATATGYSGLLGSMASFNEKKPFIVTEHGIYTREREEELLRAQWVPPGFRQQWIELFYQFSDCAYRHAKVVTALFSRANLIQQELGCSPKITRVIPNGVHYERFADIAAKKPDGVIDIGAVVRIARIKDIKTMLYAFLELHERLPRTKLHILGSVDDEEYMEECRKLIEVNRLEGVIFTGLVNVTEYLAKLDFTILSSISEGQPLSVLESLAAGRPVVATDVGCCRELIEGEPGDDCGAAGYLVPPMNKTKLTQAMYRMCVEEEDRRKMGENGRKRVEMYYTHKKSMGCYDKLYQEVMEWQELDLN